jgi:hypothetical protein
MSYTPAVDSVNQYIRDIAAALNGGGNGSSTASGSTNSVAVPASASNQVVKATPGVLFKCVVTATGTTNALIYDNASAASGKVIGVVPSTVTVGQVFEFSMPASAGITVGGATTNPAFTLSYA